MFQRIARRQADRPGETTSDPAAEPATTTPAGEDAGATAPPEARSGDGQAAVDQPTTELATDDRPTERIEAVSPAPSAPPPAIDLTTRLAPVDPAVAPTPAAAAPAAGQQADPATATATAPTVTAEPAQARRPGFRARGRMRRRLRYLRRLRELQVRDLGGLVFDLRRFERKRDDLLAQKVDQIRACDDELHALERALEERRDLRDVREPGIGGTCPRCFAIYGSADKFCANCGAAFGGAVQGPAAQVPLAPAPSTTPQPASPPEAGGAGGQGSQA